jgi:hypothetical protein
VLGGLFGRRQVTLRLHAINFAMLRTGFRGCAVLGLLDALGGALSFRLLRKGTGKRGLLRVVGVCWQGLDLQHVGHCFACGVPGVGESTSEPLRFRRPSL